MQDIFTRLGQLNRPKLLVAAAKAAAADYQRMPHLARLLGSRNLPRHSEALLKLLEQERRHEDMRCSDHIGYSVIAHVDIMIAIVGEAQLLRTSLQTETSMS